MDRKIIKINLFLEKMIVTIHQIIVLALLFSYISMNMWMIAFSLSICLIFNSIRLKILLSQKPNLNKFFENSFFYYLCGAGTFVMINEFIPAGVFFIAALLKWMHIEEEKEIL